MDLKVVSLLTDFGMQDPYVAEMKAVILTHCPQIRIVDISHEISKFNVHMGAFVLASAAPYFPDGTVHVAVVDPDVGTKRRPIIVETSRSFYVGPDNGVVMLAASRDGLRKVFVIERSSYLLSAVSNTFHGRDVFAPAAAGLAMGCDPSSFGREIQDYLVPSFAKPVVRAGAVLGEILHVDSFGNIITSIPVELLKEELTVHEGD
jgi:S-adenosylmethionine hydrolase